jgi:glucose/mannose transport system substrate-binding protein
MVKAFEQYRLMVSKYMDPAIAGRDYDTRDGHDRQGQAVFMIMGDWQVGIFTAAGLKQGADYVCAQAPTDWGKPGFILNSDSVAFFTQTDPDYVAGQKLLAHLIMSPQFQTVFNQAKGSIPARLDVDLEGLQPCQQQSQKDLQASIADGTLVRSMAHNMTILQKYRGAMMDTITVLREHAENDAEGSRRRDGRRRRRAEVLSKRRDPAARRLRPRTPFSFAAIGRASRHD